MPISAFLVFDGSDEIHIPSHLGRPRADQMQGTTAERLAELAGRICYDSLGAGRSSAEYHRHILEVSHLSVWEHFNFTIEVRLAKPDLFPIGLQFCNRPGIHLQLISAGGQEVKVAICANVRAILDYEKWRHSDPFVHDPCIAWGQLWSAAKELAPQAFPNSAGSYLHATYLNPTHPEHQWISLFLQGSRGFSHEQVRHRWRTAVSQRSTRYCDESESDWVVHPLLAKLQDALPWERTQKLLGKVIRTTERARKAYDELVFLGQMYLKGEGADAHTARKQARGMARGYLGNALETEMLFSASVAQWKRMLEQRLTVAADAEIRLVYEKALSELKRSRYGSAFESYKLVDSPDGLGKVLKQ